MLNMLVTICRTRYDSGSVIVRPRFWKPAPCVTCGKVSDMRKILVSALLAGAATLLSMPAQAAVFVDGFTLDTGSFGGQNGVHSTGTQAPSSTLTGFVNMGGANNGVTFSTTTGLMSITGGGEATISGEPKIEDLTVVFQKGWDKVTFNFEGEKTDTFTLLVNGSALFSATPNLGDAACNICVLGNNGKFTISGTGITSLAFTFNPGITAAKQFRVEGVSTAPIPEPATWAMMIGGLGLAGAALRRRATKVQFA